jgi:hypothetical protein
LKKRHCLNLIFFVTCLACHHPKKDDKKIIPKKEIEPIQHTEKEVLKQETISQPDTIKNKNARAHHSGVPSNKKSIFKSIAPDLLTEHVENTQQNTIIPGYVKSSFFKDGNSFHFKRKVKMAEDRNVGCSGGENELSFIITNPGDTFIIEGEMLNAINFNYKIQGGLKSEEGGIIQKGRIKGILMSDHNWKIEIEVWVKMKDLQLEKEIERKIMVNDKFIK